MNKITNKNNSIVYKDNKIKIKKFDIDSIL